MTPSGMRQVHDHPSGGRNIADRARNVVASPWIGRLTRFGHVIRGIIYFVPGALALRLALNEHGHATSQAGAIDIIARQPFGRMLLVAVAVGLAGYAMWGVVRAVFDPLSRGHSPGGLAQRFGYTMSAVAYAVLFAATVRFLTGTLSHVAPAQDWTVGLMARPFGALFVGVVGCCWVFGSGLPQIVQGWRANFERDLDLDRVSSRERRWAIRLGRVAMVSRGIVFTVIGVLLIAAAMRWNPRGEFGLDGALLELARHSFGRLLLGAAGLGLMAFGLYSAMCARWMRVRRAGPVPAAFSSTPPPHEARYEHA